MNNAQFVKENMDLLIKAESNLRSLGALDELLQEPDLKPLSVAHLQKRSAIFLNGFFEAIEELIEGMKPNTARALNREEAKQAVSEMTNMELAEQHANQN